MPINPQEACEKIERLGSYLDHYEQRERLLRSGIGAHVDQNADYVVMSGCNPLFSLTAVRSVVDLLNFFGVRYTFLSKEVCCGRPIAEGVFYQKPNDDEERQYGNFIRRSLASNIRQAKKLEAKAIINICPGCHMIWNIHAKGQGLDIVYYTEVLAGLIGNTGLNREIDFYEGCHKLHRLEPASLRQAEESTHKLLSRIEGLKYHLISDGICCRTAPDKIFSTVKTETLVTPSQCCYSILMAARPKNGPRVKFLAEVLLDALPRM
jgi:Fe-S oxidoreductase